MAEQKQRIPIFARGTVDQLEKALTTGIFSDLDRIIWFYVTEGDNAGSLILVYADKTLHYITDASLASNIAELGERITANAENITTLDVSLQAATDALNNYATWAENVDSSLNTLRADLDSLESDVTAIEGTIDNHSIRLTEIENILSSTLDNVTQSISVLEDKVNTSDLEGKTVSGFVEEQINNVKDYVDQVFDWSPM